MLTERTMAWEQLNDSTHCGRLGMVEFEDLMVRAGYDPGIAHKAAMERGWRRLSLEQLL